MVEPVAPGSEKQEQRKQKNEDGDKGKVDDGKAADKGQKKKRGSLAELAGRYFGKPLSKEVTMVNWEVRPLKNAWVEYAGLDAIVPIEYFLGELKGRLERGLLTGTIDQSKEPKSLQGTPRENGGDSSTNTNSKAKSGGVAASAANASATAAEESKDKDPGQSLSLREQILGTSGGDFGGEVDWG